MDLPFDVVELPDATHPTRGESAPDFTRPLVGDEYWEDASLSDLASPICLVFFPMAGSFPATYIWSEIRDRELDAMGTVVGVSISTPYACKRLIEEQNLDSTTIRLFADPQNEIAEDYGVSHTLGGMAGIREPRPATFVLDDDRKIEYAWAASEWPEFPEYDALETAFTEAIDHA